MIDKQSNGNAITQAFKDAVIADSRQFLAKLFVNGTELECDIDSITVTKGSCASDTFSVGSVIGSCLTANVRRINQTIKGETLEYRVGLWTGADYEWVTIGTYTVSEVKNTHYTSVVTAYSSIVADTNMLLVDISPSTIDELATAVSTQIGRTIIFDSDIDTTAEIADSLNGITVYEALQVIAICGGGYVINDPNNDILVKQYDATPTLSVNAGMMTSLPVIAENEFDVKSVYCLVRESASDEDTGLSYGAQPYSLVAFTNNEEQVIVNEVGVEIEADKYVDDADVMVSSRYVSKKGFSNIKSVVGYAYYPSSIGLTLGDPRIEGSDVLAVTDIDGAVYTVPCHTLIHNYTGGFETEITAVDATDKENNIGTSMPITTQIKSVAKDVANVSAKTQYFWHSDAGAHVTEVPRADFEAEPANGGGNTLITSEGMKIRDGVNELASFTSSNIQIGESDSGHSTFSDDGMKIHDGAKELASFTPSGVQIGESNSGHSLLDEDGMQIYAKAGTIITNLGYGEGWNASGEKEDAPYFSLGIRNPSSNIGNYSTTMGGKALVDGLEVMPSASGFCAVAEGISKASGWFGHAEGKQTTASGTGAHSEGGSTTASGEFSHAEGYNTTANEYATHAEGRNTTASNEASHAEGYYSVASGKHSHASGEYTTAQGWCQTVIGAYNVAQGSANTHANTDNAFIVGNGALNARSNALALTWAGKLTIASTLTQNSDKRLKEHKSYLGEDAVEFVKSLKPAHYIKDGEDHLGFYAQDVEEIDKWGCMTGEMNGYKTLGYLELIAPLVAYCQHLEERIKELEK